MPSSRVEEPTVSLSIYDVVGKDGGEDGFISHAGLAESSGSHIAGRLPVLDMGPPLHGQSGLAQMEASVVGSAILTDDEERKIQTFIDRHANEHRAFQEIEGARLIVVASQMYCIHPHMSPYDEEDGRYVRMRFSCAGFVFEAYKTARIKLLDTDALPKIEMELIKSAYPGQTRLMETRTISQESLGLEGSGPWQVMLCGYLFHALNRDSESIRDEQYKPSTADRYFT